jgi:hypothetical protein
MGTGPHWRQRAALLAWRHDEEVCQMTYLVILIVAAGIGFIVRAVRASGRRQEMAAFEVHASSAAPAFPLRSGEVITLAVAARDLGALRRLVDDTIADQYPSSFPLVACTSERLVIQMSVTDRTTDLTGLIPPRRPDLRHRIGEQFTSADHQVSSCEWPWATISSLIAAGDTAGLLWESERGSGAVTLTFMSVGDQTRFVTTAVAAITTARSLEGILPVEPARIVDGETVTSTFAGARVLCSDCGAPIPMEDRYCTGCGVLVFRLARADS